ncbi:MAG: amidohydrolase family protein [Bacteroidales bacterium]|nr:amidohydrolase family protein [Bacteroidales bacterium]
MPVIFLAASLIVAGDAISGCNKYDDSQIRKDIEDLREQVASEDSLVRFVSYDKQTVKNGDRIELVLASSVTRDSYAGIQVDVVSNCGTVTAVATKSESENSWKIKALNPEFDQDGKVTENPAVVIINAGEYLTDAFLKVYLIDSGGRSHVATKAITSGERPVADLIVCGKIFTSDSTESIAEAFAVKNGKYLYVGTKAGAEEFAGAATERVDFTDKGLVIPGCTEGHGHFVGLDGIVRQLPGFRATYEELINTVVPQAMASKIKPFLSFGWNTVTVEKFGTTDYASEIETVSKGQPVILIDGGGHNALCNRTALKMAGIIDDSGKKIKDVRGGDVIVIRDGDGNPTDVASGYITDEVVPYLIENTIGQILDDAQYYNACLNAVAELNKRGFTNYLDAYINGVDAGETYIYLTDMDRFGLLTVNLMGYYTIRSYDWGMPKGGPVPERVKAKIEFVGYLDRVFTGGHINAGGIKLFQDGVTDTGTGWISEEYTKEGIPADKKHGNKIWEQEELNQIVAAANAKGFPVHTHTFGDLACHALIDAYAASPSASTLRIHNSLAHVRNISAADIARCGANGIDIASNMIWHTGVPEEIRQYMLSIMPSSIFDSGYPMKSLMEAGIRTSSSTDAPCGEELMGTVPNIIGASVTGLSPDFPNADPFNPSELLTVRQVLKCLTIYGAASLGLGEERGSIEKGKYADFVVLDKDVLELEETNKMDIFSTNVASTWFEGRKVYDKQMP